MAEILFVFFPFVRPLRLVIVEGMGTIIGEVVVGVMAEQVVAGVVAEVAPPAVDQQTGNLAAEVRRGTSRFRTAPPLHLEDRDRDLEGTRGAAIIVTIVITSESGDPTNPSSIRCQGI